MIEGVIEGVTGGKRGAAAVAARGATQERLRRIIREIEGRSGGAQSVARPVARGGAERAVPPGWSRRETESGFCGYRERRHSLSGTAGTQPLAEVLQAAGPALAVLAPGGGAEGARPEDLLFLDIETTGLGGAGTIAFLVTTGRLAAGDLVLRQYLAPSPAEEGAMLRALLDDTFGGGQGSPRRPVLVTYNGRAFDAPLLDERATMHRLRAGFDALPHVDLLLPARLLYRRWLPSCRLSEVERAVLGFERPGEDVPGAEVPAHYFRYLRTGDARWLAPVVLHNELDVLVLAGLAGRMAAMVAGTRRATGPEALGMARLRAARGHTRAAGRQLAEALEGSARLAPGGLRDEALMLRGRLHKSAGRRQLAAPAWREVAGRDVAARPGGASLVAHVELAKYYEHYARWLDAALAVVERALGLVERRLAPVDAAQAERWRGSLLHRRARIHSKALRAAAAGARRAAR